MGLVGLPTICEALIAHGVHSDMPIALIERGTTANQRVHVGTLGTIVDQITSIEIKPPTLLIIGTVVTLHTSLQWFAPIEPEQH